MTFHLAHFSILCFITSSVISTSGFLFRCMSPAIPYSSLWKGLCLGPHWSVFGKNLHLSTSFVSSTSEHLYPKSELAILHVFIFLMWLISNSLNLA
jgi:hypothetical protein